MKAMSRGWRPGTESEWLETGVAELVGHGVPEHLVRDWTIPDDIERSDSLAEATDEELHDLIDGTNLAAERLVTIIYTDRTDAAAVLAGSLTDAVQEAELELARRHRRRRGSGDIPAR